MNSNLLNNLTNFIKKRSLEFIGLLIVFFSLFLFISLITYSPNDPSLVYGIEDLKIANFFGFYGSVISDFLLQCFGVASFLITFTLCSWGVNLTIKKKLEKIFLKIFYVFLYLIFTCVLVFVEFNNSFWLVDNGNSGFLGRIIHNFIYRISDKIDSQYFTLFLAILSLTFFVLASDINFRKIIIIIFNLFKSSKPKINNNFYQENENEEVSQSTNNYQPQQSFFFEKNNESKNLKVQSFKLPSIDLLIKNNNKKNHDEISGTRPNSEFMEKVLMDFGIEGKIKKINNGPVVSLYEFEPAPGIKVSKIINLSDDIARNTSSTSTRVAVIPGKNTVGIEIPNETREGVLLRDVLVNEKFKKKEIKLPIALGKSISGQPLIADLSSMPHLLIAGTTGSGKSVCINTIIVSLLYKLSPEICKFILIDPKMLELSSYEGIPNLLCPVITDSKKATSALGWTVREMNNRYKLMSKVGVRNIDGYNQKHKLKMPYIVVVVDEMSDLMLVAGKEIENYIQKLSQMARAAGIHIIMATQRPSVDVITGTIKANFPTRISFQVSSRIDSRTILGEQGAEQLLGKGDMLFMSSANRITRIHGPYISEKEIEQITSVLRAQGEPDYLDDITTDKDNNEITDLNDTDDLYNEALKLIKAEGKASTSFLQRKLQIGYNRAARIIDQMEEKGVVSKANHVGKREVL